MEPATLLMLAGIHEHERVQDGELPDGLAQRVQAKVELKSLKNLQENSL